MLRVRLVRGTTLDESRYQITDVGNVWPGACVFPDYSQGRVRACWGDLHQSLLEQGVAGIWNDMNEPSLTNMMVKDAYEAASEPRTMDDDVVHRSGGKDPATMPRLVELNVEYTNDLATAIEYQRKYWAGAYMPALYNQKIYTPAMSAQNGEVVGPIRFRTT